MARKLWEDGVPIVFEEYEGMPHCFALILAKAPNTKRCFESWTGFMESVIRNPGGINSKAVTIKAKTREVTCREFASLTTMSKEDIHRRVLTKMESMGSAIDAAPKL